MKNTVKEATKLPKNHIMVGMSAFLLLLAAPLIVAMVDESASIDTSDLIDYDETKLLGAYNLAYNNSGGTAVFGTGRPMATVNLFYPSENEGMYMIQTDGTSEVVSMNLTFGEDHPILSGAVTKVTIYTSLECTKLQYRMTTLHWFHFTQISPGVWEREFSTAERLMIKGVDRSDLTSPGTLNFQGFSDNFPNDGIVEVGIELYGDQMPLYYASFVWGVVGVLLLLAALFATDTVDVKTITSKTKKAFKGGKK